MRMIFVNLPVSDLDRAKRFYEALGFDVNAKRSFVLARPRGH